MKSDLKVIWLPILVDSFLPSQDDLNTKKNTSIKDIKSIFNSKYDTSSSKIINYLINMIPPECKMFVQWQLRERKFYRKITNTKNKDINYSYKVGEETKNITINCSLFSSDKHINLDKITVIIKTKNTNEYITIIIDSFGFIFVDYSCDEKNEDILYRLFDNVKNYGIYELLTSSQIDLLDTTILNSNIEIKNFPSSEDEKQKKKKFKKFISEITVNSEHYKKAIQESTQDKYISDNYGKKNFKDYSDASSNGDDIFSLYLQGRTYEIPSIKKFINDFGKDDQKHNLFKASIQDRLETLAIERFLSVSTSKLYSEKIINNITAVREGLVDKLVFLTENKDSKKLSKLAAETKDWREEKIERYVEYILSETASFYKLDKLLRAAFYYKIGNTSYFNFVGSTETIDKLSSYHYWKSVLKSLEQNTRSLKTILDLYHNKKMYSETHDINHRQSSLQDNKLIQYALGENKVVSTLSTEDKDFFTGIALFIALITFLANVSTILPVSDDEKLKYFFILSMLALVIFIPLKRLIIYISRNHDIWTSAPFSFLEYRSKHSLKAATCLITSREHIDLKLTHIISDNFLNNTKELINRSFFSHNKYPKIIPDLLMNNSKLNIRAERENPHRRHIEISFTFNPEKNQNLTKDNLQAIFKIDKSDYDVEPLKDLLREIKNSFSWKYHFKIYCHYIVVYTFNLRDEGGNNFDIYKDSVRIYYSLRYRDYVTQNIKLQPGFTKANLQRSINELELDIGHLLYHLFARPFHSESSEELFMEKLKKWKKGIVKDVELPEYLSNIKSKKA